MKSELFGLGVKFQKSIASFKNKANKWKRNFQFLTICLIRQACSLELLGPGLLRTLYLTIPDKFTDD